MKHANCSQCKRPFDLPNTGRPKKFCSDRCRLVNFRQRQKAKAGLRIPNELAAVDRWVRHIRKRPVTAEGRAASVTDPSTWCSLADANASAIGDGLGFVLGEGVGCIDLDDALTASGKLTPAAAEFMARVPATWVEVSPSGRGLHIWGRLPEAAGRVTTVAGQDFEVYSRGRYITVTGRLFEGSALKLADLSGFVDSLL